MNGFQRAVIGRENKRGRSDIIWNMAGSMIFAFSSLILTVVVSRVLGDEQGGIFSFALTTIAQQILTITYFGIRPVHITDVSYRHSFGDYMGVKRFSSALSLGAVLCYVLYYVAFSQHTLYEGAIVLIMSLYKIIDGFSDAYEAEFQRGGRLYLTGKSNAFRTLISMAVFLIVLGLTKSLLFCCLAAFVSAVICLRLFNISILKQLPDVEFSMKTEHCKEMIKESFLLFTAAFLDFYIFSSAKHPINNQLGNVASGIFGAVFMPTSIINLAASFVIRPFLTTMSVKWQKKDRKGFLELILKLCLIILGLGAAALSAAWFLGIPVLQILYRAYDLKPYRNVLLIIVLGGAFFAVVTVFYYALVIMKRQKYIFIGYVFVAVLAFFLSRFLVSRFGLMGGAVSYCMVMAVLAITLILIMWIFFKKDETV